MTRLLNNLHAAAPLPPEAAFAFEEQARICDAMGSPFLATLLGTIAHAGLPDGPVADRIANWAGDVGAKGDAVPLRFAAALHRLVLEDRDSSLKGIFPPETADEDEVWGAVCGATVRHADVISAALDLPPQTNETGRAAIMLPAILACAAASTLPLRILELGSSAGLNLNLDRFRYNYGRWQWGDPHSPVSLDPDWSGPSLAHLAKTVSIAERRGCDIAPVDISTPAAATRLLSFVWPDQTARLERLRGALSIAIDHPPEVTQASAPDWLSAQLGQRHGRFQTVVMHTVMWQYLPEDAQQKCTAIISKAGHLSAANGLPLTWLRFEADGRKPGGALLQTRWNGSRDDGQTVMLARADFHGNWIDWFPVAKAV